MGVGAILSGKNYPLFPRQILHEIFMMRVVDSTIDFGQSFAWLRVYPFPAPSAPLPLAFRSRCRLPFVGLSARPVPGMKSGGREEEEEDGPRIIRVHPPFSRPSRPRWQKAAKPGKMASVRTA